MVMDDVNILRYLQFHPMSSRKDIAEGIMFDSSDTTLKKNAVGTNIGGEYHCERTRQGYSL